MCNEKEGGRYWTFRSDRLWPGWQCLPVRKRMPTRYKREAMGVAAQVTGIATEIHEPWHKSYRKGDCY